MLNLWAFILLIGPLIFIHELGHLVAAKLVGVKVTRFSLGFGPPLVRFRMGETEYCIAPIPLGGYVSMLGHGPQDDVPIAEADRALSSKPLWARYFVLGAGPAANLILPVLVFFFSYVMTLNAVRPPVLGTILPDSAAEQADLQQGDRVVAIEGRDVRSWTEMTRRIEEAPGQELRIQIERDGKRLDRVITPKTAMKPSPLGGSTPVGRLGVLAVFYEPQIGMLDTNSPAYQGGLRTGDVITSINGEPVRTIEELERLLETTNDSAVRLTYLRPQPLQDAFSTYLWYESHHAQLLPAKGEGNTTGILPAHTFVRSVDPGSPADKAGLRAGDRILAVDGEPLRHWQLIHQILARNGEGPLSFEVQSPGGEPRTVEVDLQMRVWKDIYQQDNKALWFGANPFHKSFEAEREPLRGRFTYALGSSVYETGQVISMLWTALVQMLTFERGVEELSSVVGLYKVAGTAFEQGPGEFLQLLAMLSINLGIINLLPIPVLDGGHLMFFTIEAIRRRPLGQRGREIAAAIGIVIILLLLLIATRNDILRYWQ